VFLHFYFSNILPSSTEGNRASGCVGLRCFLRLNYNIGRTDNFFLTLSHYSVFTLLISFQIIVLKKCGGWSKASTHAAGVREEDRLLLNESPPLPSSSCFHLLLLSVTSHGMEYPFDWFRPAALVMFLSSPFAHPLRGLEKGLILCHCCSAADTTLVW